MPQVYAQYRASANLTVTNLESLAASGTWTAGWYSETIDNTTDKDIDIVISGKFVPAAATSGEIRVYAFAQLDDSNWPALGGSPGTQGTGTVTSEQVRDANMTLVWSSATTSTATKSMPQTSLAGVFGGFLPVKVGLFVAISGSALSTGNQITKKGITETVS
jgi:hypothetical protein